jgi:alpha-D-ribose 1-methylphosphonate 5-phosphate C-P lyase
MGHVVTYTKMYYTEIIKWDKGIRKWVTYNTDHPKDKDTKNAKQQNNK